MNESRDSVLLRLVYALREFKQSARATVILGAGCSLSSSPYDISTTSILKKCLYEHGVENCDELSWHELYSKFVNIVWEGKAYKERMMLLENKLKHVKPSNGYIHLRTLVENGYVKNLITTNFDMLLDKSMDGLSYNILVGDGEYETVGDSPTFNILKVHGDLRHGKLRFAPHELAKLPNKLENEIIDKTSGLLIFIGYRGQDIGLMNSLCAVADFAVYWIDINQPDSLDSYTTKQIFNFMGQRESINNFITGRQFGDFDNIMQVLCRDLITPSKVTILKSKESQLPRMWDGTFIVELLQIHGRVFELFLDILQRIEEVYRNSSWRVAYPNYSKNYKDVLNAYLFFFNQDRLPSDLLNILKNEIDALVTGVSLEIMARVSGINISFHDFLFKVKEKFENVVNNKLVIDKSFWITLENILYGKDIECEDTIKLKTMEGPIIESYIVPAKEIMELLKVIEFLALLQPTAVIEDQARFDSRYMLRRFLQDNYKSSKIEREKIKIELGQIANDEVNDLLSAYLGILPSKNREEIHTDADGKHLSFDTKWVSLRIDIKKESSERKPIEDTLYSIIVENSKKYSERFLTLESVFKTKKYSHIELKLDRVLNNFLVSSKKAIFVIGSSGSGKTTSLQYLTKKLNTETNRITIPISPKFVSINSMGLSLFLYEIFKNVPNSKTDAALKDINALLDLRGKELILIFDGLNEIPGSIENQVAHYQEFVWMARKLHELNCIRIKLLISCRENAYLQYKRASNLRLSHYFFYSKPNDDTIEKYSSEDAYYKIKLLNRLEIESLLELYFKQPTIDLINRTEFFSSGKLALKNSNPFFIALAGETFQCLKNIRIIKSQDDIYDLFSKTMLSRLDDEDCYLARKIIYAYFLIIIQNRDSIVQVTKFKLLNNLPPEFHGRFSKILSDMMDLNIFTKDEYDGGSIKFFHDKIEEFFFKEFLKEFESQGNSFILDAVELIKINVIYQRGLQQYFNLLIKRNELKMFNDLSLLLFKNFSDLIPQIVVEALANSVNLKTTLKYLLKMSEQHNNIILMNIIIWGLDYFLVDYSNMDYDLSSVISALLSISEETDISNEHQAYLYLFSSKLSYFVNNYEKAQRFAERSLVLVKEDNPILTSKINLHLAVILMELGYSKISLEKLKSAFEEQKANGDWQTIFEIGIELGRALFHNGQLEYALEIHDFLLSNENKISDPYIIARIYEQEANVLDAKMYALMQYNFVDSKSLSRKNIENVKKLRDRSVFLYDRSMELLIKNNCIFNYSGVVPEKIKSCISYSYSFEPFKLDECKLMIEELDEIFKHISTPFETDYLVAKAYYYEYFKDFKMAFKCVNKAIDNAIKLNIQHKETTCHMYQSRLIYRIFLHNADIEDKEELLKKGLNSLERSIAYYQRHTSPENHFLIKCYELRDLYLHKAKSYGVEFI